MNKNLNELNEIQKEIEDLEKFLFVVTKYDKKSKGIDGVSVVINIETKMEMSILGFRRFGFGTHKKTINVPNELRNDLINLCRKQIEILKKEFEDKIPNLMNS